MDRASRRSHRPGRRGEGCLRYRVVILPAALLLSLGGALADTVNPGREVGSGSAGVVPYSPAADLPLGTWLGLGGIVAALVLLVARQVLVARRLARDLHDCRTRLADLHSISGVATWDADPELQDLRWSPQARALLGISAETAPAAIPDIEAVAAEAERENVRAAVQTARQAQDGFDLTFALDLQGGTPKQGRVRGIPVRKPDGSLAGFRGTLQEVTGQRAASDRQQRRAEQLRLIIEGVRFTLWEWDLHTDAVHIESRSTTISVGPVAELNTGKRIIQRVHPEDADRLQRELTAHLEGRTSLFSVEVRVQSSHGDWVWILFMGVVSRRDADGKPQTMVGIAQDISGRKRGELQLRRQTQRLQEAQANAALAYWEYRPEERVLVAPRRFGEILALQTQTPGRYPCDTVFGSVHPEDRRQVETEFLNALQHHTRYERTVRILDANAPNAVRYAYMAGRPHHGGQSGQAVSMTGTVQDVTERMALEQELLQSQKMEAVGRLAGGVAHDFNNVLQAVIGYSRLALDELPPGHAAREDLAAVLEAGDRARDLVRQLLLFSKPGRVRMQSLDLNEVVAGFRKMLDRLIGERITIEVQGPPELWSVHGDRGQIEQVLMNLCVNARDAMPNGGMILISTRERQITVPDRRAVPAVAPGEFVELAVSDTGQGIAPQDLQHIYEPFFTTKGKESGTGLGLATVYSILRAHNGCILCESEVSRGTTFRVLLPRATGRPVDEAEQETGSTPDDLWTCGGGEIILVVEDDRRVLELTERVLTRAGYTVLAATSSAEALRLLDGEERRVDMVVTELLMKDANGLAFARKLRAGGTEVPVLFCNGYADSNAIGILPHLQERDIVTKPFAPDHLLAKVRQALSAEPLAGPPQAGTDRDTHCNRKAQVGQ